MKRHNGQAEFWLLIIVGVALIALAMFGYPAYNVWSSKMGGEAVLAHATYSRQVAVKEAEAKRDSAVMLAQAEIERAKGVAAANKIIGDSLKGNEEYLRYLYINNLAEKNGETIIYVPTENGMPILEAGRGVKKILPEPPKE